MKKYKKILLAIISLLIFTNNVFATTIKETTTENDKYDTIETNTTIIGVTKFTPNEVITASKATKAGANDAMLYTKKNGTTDGYIIPTIYIYYGDKAGWYSLDENNKPTYIQDQALLNKLSNLDIYYVNNKEKIIGVEYTGDDIDTTKLPSGVNYSNNLLQINSTLSFFDIYTKKNDKISYSFNDTLNTFEIDNSSCYTIKDGYITDYDSTCSKNVVIPSKIKNEKIIGIQNYAFYDKEITSIVIPETIMNLGNNAFANNDLKSVTINEKFDSEDFEKYGSNVFGSFSEITYNNILTRAVKEIPDELNLKLSDKLNTKYANSSYFSNEECSLSDDLECYKFNMAIYKIRKILSDKGYENIHTSSYEEDMENIEVLLQIYDEKTEEWKHIETNRKIKYELIETTNNPYNELVEEIVNKNDEYLEKSYDYKNSTSSKTLNELSEKYNVELFGGNESIDDYERYEDTNIYTKFLNESISIIKDDVLYGVISYVNNVKSRHYVAENRYDKDLNTIEEHIELVLKEFEEKTTVNNYQIIKTEDGKDYIEDYHNEVWMIEAPENGYGIKLVDLDTEMIWYIIINVMNKDQYDENGNTKLECFTIDNNTITEYDYTCGANVVIPKENKNGEKITKIGNGVFNQSMIKTVKLTNNITEIGESAFSYNHELKEIELPENLEHIRMLAFYNTGIKELDIPKTVKNIEANAFIDTNIKEVTIPKTVETIGDYVFNEETKINFENKIDEIAYKIEDSILIDINEEIQFKEQIKAPEDTTEYEAYLETFTNAYIEKLINEVANKPYQEWKCPEGICDYYINYELVDSWSYESNYDIYMLYNIEIHNNEKVINKEVRLYIGKIKRRQQDIDKITNIIKNELKDEYLYKHSTEIDESIITTTDRKMKELEEKYDIEILQYKLGGGNSCAPYNIEEKEQILSCDHIYSFLYFIKDDILYKISDMVDVTNDILTYYPTIELKDYESLDVYVNEVLKKFSEKTGITDYEIELHNGNKYELKDTLESSNGESIKLDEEFYHYNIDIVDKTNNRNWDIKFKYHNFNQ